MRTCNRNRWYNTCESPAVELLHDVQLSRASVVELRAPQRTSFKQELLGRPIRNSRMQ